MSKNNGRNNGRNRVNSRNRNNMVNDRNMGMTIFIVLLLVVILGIAIYFYYVNYVNPPTPLSINNARNQLIKNTTYGNYGIFLQKIEEKETKNEGFQNKCVSKIISKRFQFNKDCDKLKIHKVILEYCKDYSSSQSPSEWKVAHTAAKTDYLAKKKIVDAIVTQGNTPSDDQKTAAQNALTALNKLGGLSATNCDSYDYITLYDDDNYSEPIHFKDNNNKTITISNIKPDLKVVWSHDGGLHQTNIISFSNTRKEGCGRKYELDYPIGGTTKCMVKLFLHEKYSN